MKLSAQSKNILRQVRRKQIIAQHLGQPHLNRGPLGATIAFESDSDVLDDATFQKRVLDGIGSLEKRISTLEDGAKTTRKTMEDKHAEILKAMPKDVKATLEEIEK